MTGWSGVAPGREARASAPAVVDAPPFPAAVDASPETMRNFSLADHWELDKGHKRGVFNFRPHLVNYLMLPPYRAS